MLVLSSSSSSSSYYYYSEQKRHFYSAAFHELTAPLDHLILAVILQMPIVEVSIYIFDDHDNKNYPKTPTIEIDLPKDDIETSFK